MRDDLMIYKEHPRILELRLASYKTQLARNYGDEQAMEILHKLADLFQCNWTMLVGVFNKDHKILNAMAAGSIRRKQEVIFMGYLYGETRYYIAEHYLGMSVNYLYQNRDTHNPDAYVTEEWLEPLDDEIHICGARSYATEAKRFIISMDNFMGTFR